MSKEEKILMFSLLIAMIVMLGTAIMIIDKIYISVGKGVSIIESWDTKLE